MIPSPLLPALNFFFDILSLFFLACTFFGCKAFEPSLAADMVGMSQLNDGDDGDGDDSISEVGKKKKSKRHHQQSEDEMYSQFADYDDDDDDSDGDDDSGSGRKKISDDGSNEIDDDNGDDSAAAAAEDEMMTLRQQALLRPATELRDRLGHAKLELSDLARESVEKH